MTIEIVGIDETRYKFVTCGNCARRLKYTNFDKNSYVDYDYGGGSDRIEYIICPNCDQRVTGLNR